MNPLVHRYTNRYGDIFTFTLQEDGTYLWEGGFEYCRVGYPNNYNEAFTQYIIDKGTLTLKEFKEKVHEYDSDKGIWKYKYLNKYRELITPDTTKLDMVDPSGGPYIAVGMEFLGGIITSIEQFKTGYKLTIDKNENRD